MQWDKPFSVHKDISFHWNSNALKMIIHRQFLRLQREIILQYSSVTSYFDGFKESEPVVCASYKWRVANAAGASRLGKHEDRTIPCGEIMTLYSF